MERIFHPGLLLLHLGLGGCADFNDGHTAGQLRQPLLEFFLVVVRGRLINLSPDLFDPSFDHRTFSCAFNDGAIRLC